MSEPWRNWRVLYNPFLRSDSRCYVPSRWVPYWPGSHAPVWGLSYRLSGFPSMRYRRKWLECALQYPVVPTAKRVHVSSPHVFPPFPCPTQYPCWDPCASFEQDTSLHLLPPPWATQYFVEPWADLEHPTTWHLTPPPCATQYSVDPCAHRKYHGFRFIELRFLDWICMFTCLKESHCCTRERMHTNIFSGIPLGRGWAWRSHMKNSTISQRVQILG